MASLIQEEFRTSAVRSNMQPRMGSQAEEIHLRISSSGDALEHDRFPEGERHDIWITSCGRHFSQDGWEETAAIVTCKDCIATESTHRN